MGAIALGCTLAAPFPARAALPEPVRAMIDAAIATGDETTVRTVVDLAKQTNPDDTAEIDAILTGFETQLAEAKAAEAAAKEEAIRTASLFENWSGKGEFGAFRATGNSSNTGITAGLTVNRQGIDWRHNLTGRVDYQRANGVTTREQFLARYEPNVKISERFYAYALAQYERDRFQGFSGRYAISGGLGYQALKRDDIQLSVKAGPAYRVTEFVDGRSESRIAGLIGVDFDWNITDRLKLTQDTNAVAETGGSAVAIIDSRNTSLDFVTGLNATISSKLSARFSYQIEYDSNPPPGAVQTDTLSRVTLIYDF
ncbi:putative salt-induced outer membrane protein [Erythrobacter dokdonensis DSW-74]|jgi:putative salt-induced outer membrane protein|uniref:Putative salt-induced outer membrane protein n=2 Tax=Erythrobacter TaxID=1041 RepID=A0A1A7BIS1_9SPHN|nr:putative salt-induced outer membrane protein [Erythrobacter dokdonensis DSW-74]